MTQAVLAKSCDLHGEVGGTERGPYMAAPAPPDRHDQGGLRLIAQNQRLLFLVKQDFPRLEANDPQIFPERPVQADIAEATLRFGGEGSPGRRPALGKKLAWWTWARVLVH